jgi:hypothetical protein
MFENEKKTCGELMQSFRQKYNNSEDEYMAFQAGFMLGQAEKVYLGACQACMFRPSQKYFQAVLKLAGMVADIYELRVEVVKCEYSTETPYEIWLYDPSYETMVLSWTHEKLNSDGWHLRRAFACGIPVHKIDLEFHKRSGYGKAWEGKA